MEATEIILWSLKVLRYLFILTGIVGNLALFKKYWCQKNLRLLFNSLILWIAVIDAFYLIFLASHEGINTLRELGKDGSMDRKTRKALKEVSYAIFYLYEICFSASILTTITMAIERYLVCQKCNTNKCSFRWIFISIGK